MILDIIWKRKEKTKVFDLYWIRRQYCCISFEKVALTIYRHISACVWCVLCIHLLFNLKQHRKKLRTKNGFKGHLSLYYKEGGWGKGRAQGRDKTRAGERRKRRDQSKDKVKEKEDFAFLCLNSERRNSQFPSAVNCPSFPWQDSSSSRSMQRQDKPEVD